MSQQMAVTPLYMNVPGVMGTPGVTLNANGSSPSIDVTVWENFLLMATVVGTPTGTSPTLGIHLDGLDPWGNVYQDLCSPQPVLSFSGSTPGQAAVATVGLDAQFVASTAPGTPGSFNQLFCAPQKIQLRWVLSTGSTWPQFFMCLYARS